MHTHGACVFLSLLQRSKFNSYVKIPPFDMIGLDPGLYMLLVGIVELACVVLIVFAFISRTAVFATWVLLVIMFGALYTHFMVGDTPKDMGGAFFGLAIILTRLYTMGALWQAEVKVKV